MSWPISTCMISKAARGDEDMYKVVLDCMVYNKSQMAWTQFPCSCDPPCQLPTDEQLATFNDRLNVDIAAEMAERAKHAKPFVIPDSYVMPRFKPEVYEKMKAWPSMAEIMSVQPMMRQTENADEEL